VKIVEEDFANFLEDFCDFLNSLEEAVQKMKTQIAKLVGITEPEKPRIPEGTFTVLKWQGKKGSRLGEYEVAYKNQNVLENWQHAFNILKQSNAVIGNPFHLEGFQYRYWIYPEKYEDRIFRKKLNEVSK
jgi:hypothetical protein